MYYTCKQPTLQTCIADSVSYGTISQSSFTRVTTHNSCLKIIIFKKHYILQTSFLFIIINNNSLPLIEASIFVDADLVRHY